MADGTKKNDEVMADQMMSATSIETSMKIKGGQADDHQQDDDDDEERIEDLAIYRLDYEEEEKGAEYDDDMPLCSLPRAAGGEILQPGDHCYMWCTLYQHHAIVLETFPTTTRQTGSIPEKTPEQQHQQKNNTGDDDRHDCEQQQETPQPGLGNSDSGGGGSILIAEFTNVSLEEDFSATAAAASNIHNMTSSLFTSASTAAGATSGGGVKGGFRIVLERDPHFKWHKVKYQANPVECLTWRPGTCSSASCLPTRDILMRVHFLYEWGHALIPNYHVVLSNCETVAVWCVTGKWMTLQGDGALTLGATAAAAAAAAAVTSMAMAPVGIALAATSGGLALWRSLHVGKQCNDTAAMLNHQYEWYSLGKTLTTFNFQPTA